MMKHKDVKSRAHKIIRFPGTKLILMIKVKQSLFRPLKTHEFPGGRGPHISRKSAHVGGNFISLHTPRLYLSGNIPGTHFC